MSNLSGDWMQEVAVVTAAEAEVYWIVIGLGKGIKRWREGEREDGSQ